VVAAATRVMQPARSGWVPRVASTPRGQSMVMASAGQPAAVVQAGPTLLWMRVGDLRANDHLGVMQLLATAQAGHSGKRASP
jgi:hypothetical protein